MKTFAAAPRDPWVLLVRAEAVLADGDVIAARPAWEAALQAAREAPFSFLVAAVLALEEKLPPSSHAGA